PLMMFLRVLVVVLALLVQLGLLFLPVLLFVPAIVLAVVVAIVTVVSLLFLPLLEEAHLFLLLFSFSVPFLLEFLREILLFVLAALKAFFDVLNFHHLLQRFPLLHLCFDNFFLLFLLKMFPQFFLVILDFRVLLIVDLMCLFLAVKVVLIPARLYRHSNDHQAKRQQVPYPPLHHQNHSRHRTTTRRGHTPAAHGQSSSSPSLLSVTCSFQQKLKTRQRKARINTTKEKPKKQ
ncbi:hypothetical protein TcCL_ESM11103, partial [Trypanosoma cruzi]